MSGATEIYVCRPGQALKQGKLEYSSDISTRDEAASDAQRRCAADSGIARIAYYAVDGSGRFRNFFTYENPRAGKPQPRQSRAASGTAKVAKRRAPSLLARVRAVFEED